MKQVIVGALIALSYIGFYHFADTLCVPAHQTEGFCPPWVWSVTLFFTSVIWCIIFTFYCVLKAGQHR